MTFGPYLWPMTSDEQYMRRCLNLAANGLGSVAPNPMVGAVLVCGGKIIGEGYHQRYGQAHAEVNAIKDAEFRFERGDWKELGFEKVEDLMKASTIYVSLEPCAHYGKTPPCADLIIAKGIGCVVAGIRDPFKEVDGKGIEKLEKAGVSVKVAVLEEECRRGNRRFFSFHTKRRPYIILKWAESADGCIGKVDARIPISNGVSNVLVHRWRSEEAAILVSARTALVDDPALTNRHWPGAHPLRLVLDRHGALPAHLQVLDNSGPTLIYNTRREEGPYVRLENAENLLPAMLDDLFERKVLSVLVEGGKRLSQSFISQGLWDEIRVIRSSSVYIPGGIPAPVLPAARLEESFDLEGDRVAIYTSFAR
jgi:diaminohydroxyphosphoribosylaminopyrimidine deaminase/5-amino-6-(5-phosphoribosylamino)uracil reductase